MFFYCQVHCAVFLYQVDISMLSFSSARGDVIRDMVYDAPLGKMHLFGGKRYIVRLLQFVFYFGVLLLRPKLIGRITLVASIEVQE